MGSIIINPFTPIPKSDKSHVRGWAMIWAQRLNADIADKDSDITSYDKIFIEHGVNFSGALNLFGGFNDDCFDRCSQLIKAKKLGREIIFLDYTSLYCNYETQLRKRVGNSTSSEWLDEDFISELEQVFDSSKTWKMNSIKLHQTIVGDSHSAAFSLPQQRVLRINGQTLFGALKNGLVDFIRNNVSEIYPLGIKELDICLGSIDIRHHVIRNHINAKQFARKYAEEVIKTQDHFEIPINVCAPVPIEHEGRKLPKTGQFGGTNFYGSRQERLDFTKTFIDTLDGYCSDFDCVIPPEIWYNMKGEDYANQIMEMNSSVHIAPRNYRSIIKWR